MVVWAANRVGPEKTWTHPRAALAAQLQLNHSELKPSNEGGLLEVHYLVMAELSEVCELRAENERLAKIVADFTAEETANAKKVEKAMDRADQKIRAAGAKIERMEKKFEKEGAELVEKRKEVDRLFKECREARESSDKYKFEWDRAKEEISDLNDVAMRKHTEHRIVAMDVEDAREKQKKAEDECAQLRAEVEALSGAGDEILVKLAEIRKLKAELEKARADHATDLETARAALRAEASKAASFICPSCGYEPPKAAQAVPKKEARYDPKFY